MFSFFAKMSPASEVTITSFVFKDVHDAKAAIVTRINKFLILITRCFTGLDLNGNKGNIFSHLVWPA
jgi:hypothetical protein